MNRREFAAKALAVFGVATLPLLSRVRPSAPSGCTCGWKLNTSTNCWECVCGKAYVQRHPAITFDELRIEGVSAADNEAIREQLRRYTEGLQRYIVLKGGHYKPIV